MTKHDLIIINEEKRAIERIVRRVADESPYQLSQDQITMLEASLSHCHFHVGLDLKKLYDFNRSSLFHDVYGIDRNMNKKTKKLENCFLPRCAKKE